MQHGFFGKTPRNSFCTRATARCIVHTRDLLYWRHLVNLIIIVNIIVVAVVSVVVAVFAFGVVVVVVCIGMCRCLLLHPYQH
jgi:Na+/H+ antiporter NhaC